MPNIHELIDNVAIQLLETPSGQVWFSNLDLKNAHSLSKMCKKASKQLMSVLWSAKHRNVSIITGFYGLGDMLNNFQWVMDSILKNIPYSN